METIEYRTLDKSAWPRGPWDAEPDKRQWLDPTSGLPCLVVRHPSLGHLCGYVGVPSGHPWHGVDYDDLSPSPNVHGGLTFSDRCQHEADPSKSICHIPGGAETDDVWWLGFDCAHAYDLSPGLSIAVGQFQGLGDGDRYRDFSYVVAECESLAGQAASAAA